MLSPTILDALLTKEDIRLIKSNFDDWYKEKCQMRGAYINSGRYLVGLMYLYGKYIKQDFNLAIKFLTEAAQNFDSSAFTALGRIYKDNLHVVHGRKEIINRLKIAKILLSDSASDNDAIAILHLSIMHKVNREIIIVDEDLDYCGKKTNIYARTIKSQFNKGIITKQTIALLNDTFDYGLDNIVYDNLGKVLSEKHELMFKQLTKNARSKLAYHVFNLALAYEYGIGTEIDKKKACSLYLKARDKGHELGQQYANKLLEEYKKTTQNTSEKSKNPETKKNTLSEIIAKAPSSTTNKQSKATLQPKKSLNTLIVAKPDNKRKRDKMVDTTDRDTKAIKQSFSSIEASNEQTVQITLRDFKPQVQTDKLDYSAVKFFTKESKVVKSSKKNEKTVTSTQSLNNLNTSTQLPQETSTFTEQAIKDIGRWGEGCVYYTLEQHYRAKYPEHAFISQDTGFKLVDKRNKKNTIEIIWYNKEAELYKSKDFTVIKIRDDIVTKHRIEVKATTSNTEHTATITKNEFLKMIKYSKEDSKRYSIFRVYNVGKANQVRIEKIKDPLDKILNQELEVSSLNLKI